MLRWLEDNRGVEDWNGFLAGDGVRYQGGDFTEADVEKEASYLHGHGLVTAQSVDQGEDGAVYPPSPPLVATA